MQEKWQSILIKKLDARLLAYFVYQIDQTC